MAINSVHKPSHASLKTGGYDHRHLGRPDAVTVHMYIHNMVVSRCRAILPPSGSPRGCFCWRPIFVDIWLFIVSSNHPISYPSLERLKVLCAPK